MSTFKNAFLLVSPPAIEILEEDLKSTLRCTPKLMYTLLSPLAKAVSGFCTV